MEALRASYGEEDSSESGSDSETILSSGPSQSNIVLPPPPLSVLFSPASLDLPLPMEQPSRVRAFPHVEGNYALHIYIQVTIPVAVRKDLVLFLKRVANRVPELHTIDNDLPLVSLIEDNQRFEQVALDKVFHVSLGRTVPIRVHQRDSIVAMLRQKLQPHRRYWVDFSELEVFVNDDRTRTFLSIEVTSVGLYEIRKQIEAVNEVYRLHNLPEFYKNPRPHISIAWASGDVSHKLKMVIGDEVVKRRVTDTGVISQNRLFSRKVGGVSCKIGQKTFDVCRVLPG